MSTGFIIVIIITSYLRKRLKTSVTMPDWNKWLLWLMFGAIALLVTELSLTSFEKFAQWIGIAAAGFLLYIIYTNKKFETEKFLITALLPVLIVSALEYAMPVFGKKFYSQIENWLEPTKFFAIVWAFGTWLVTRRQRRELRKAQQKAYEEEQNNKIMSGMKAQLEVQVAERTAELTKQKEELEQTLSELKETQAQLIHSEKMASLGELTAGIAHEIQNPLNFVNNFSEVNSELINELVDEVQKGNYDEVKLIANDIKENEEKINHHGKRADAIVKGMLQHSRRSSGQKEPTNINHLCDEYVRLSYHGLRAKDKTFNAKFVTNFDETLEKINIVPQEIGRVILNLINNAFFAVNEKKQKQIVGYEPTVIIATKKQKSRVCVTVSDNGDGIPENIKDKIFQPFFTTKKAGEGTGLGLSLSYDIVKAHGGNIELESEEGIGTKFIIILPA